MKKTTKVQKAAEPEKRHAFELPDGHHLLMNGDHRTDGFEKCGDRIKLSPGREQWWVRVNAEQRGVEALVEAVSKFAAEALGRVAAEKHRWWDAVARDLGVDGRPEFSRLSLDDRGVFLRERPKEDPEAG